MISFWLHYNTFYRFYQCKCMFIMSFFTGESVSLFWVSSTRTQKGEMLILMKMVSYSKKTYILIHKIKVLYYYCKEIMSFLLKFLFHRFISPVKIRSCKTTKINMNESKWWNIPDISFENRETFIWINDIISENVLYNLKENVHFNS